MMISPERQSHIAHLVLDGLWGDELIDFDEDNEDEILRYIKIAIKEWDAEQGDIDQAVRTSLANLKRGVMEGSSEWNILYRKYFQEEMNRRGYR